MKTHIKHIALSTLSFGVLFFSACKKDNDDPDGVGVIEICTKNEETLHLSNHKNGVDYFITCDLDIASGKMMVDAGVTVAVAADKTIRVYDDGAIQINGTEAEPVTFQPGESSSLASWGGITIANNNAANNIQHIVIDRAGAVNIDGDMGYNTPFAIEAALGINGRCTINGITVKKSGGEGIYVSPQANLISLTDFTVQDCESYPLVMPFTMVKNMQGMGTFSGNGIPKIYTWGSTITGSHTWFYVGIPFLIAEDLNLDNADFQLQNGAIVEVETDKGIFVPSGSSFAAEGTASSPVIIRGKLNYSGWWKGVLFESTSPLNTWTNVELSNTGSSPLTIFDSEKAGLYLGGAFGAPTRWTGTNVYIHDGDGCGIIRRGSSITYSGTNVTFANTDSEICDL